jgi:hypothetical protein
MLKKFLNWIGPVVVPFLAYRYIRLLKLTMRSERVGYGPYRKLMADGRSIIMAFWHGRLILMPVAYEGNNSTVLISRHRDGEFVARTMHRFGIKTSRGSTTRGWMEGIKGMLAAAKGGGDLALAPDGPKGPARKAQMGVIQLARKTGMPIVPFAFGASKKKLSGVGTPSCCRTLFPGACTSALTQ